LLTFPDESATNPRPQTELCLVQRYNRLLTREFLAAAFTAAIGFFLLGYGAILIMPKGNSAAVIWPATAFAACVILRYARGWNERAVMLAGVTAADLLNNGLGGDSLLMTLGYTVVNVLELAVALAIAGRGRALRSANMRETVLRTLAISLLPPMLGGGASVMIAWLDGQQHLFVSGLHWFIADALGFLMIFPIGMAISWRQIRKLQLRRRLPLAVACLSLLVAVTVLVFRLHVYPLQFLIMPAAIIVTRWFRMLGAGLSVIIIAVIVLTETVPPLPFDAVTRVQLLQLFLAVCSLVCVRVAGVLNERDLHIAIIERRHRRVVRASSFKSQLLSHVSHEVRSPLSAIIGFSAMLEKGTLTPDRAPEFAAIIAHNGELLQRLHDDLLDMGRAEAGVLTMRSERVAVGGALHNCVSAIRLDATLGGKDVLLEEVADSLALQADPLRLAQILNNLIANAFKYGDNFSPIRVRAHALANGFGRIEIANTGPGIPAAEHDAVFLPFRRSIEVGRNVPGAGLGLSIAKMLVEAQGGCIAFDSVPGRQTRFWIDLPLAA
jgi:signal transduction histidine kinase